MSGPGCVLTPEAARFVESARVAHLASSSAEGQPHVVPVCFALVKGRIYVGLDAKPKSVDPLRLRRSGTYFRTPGSHSWWTATAKIGPGIRHGQERHCAPPKTSAALLPRSVRPVRGDASRRRSS